MYEAIEYILNKPERVHITFTQPLPEIKSEELPRQLE